MEMSVILQWYSVWDNEQFVIEGPRDQSILCLDSSRSDFILYAFFDDPGYDYLLD